MISRPAPGRPEGGFLSEELRRFWKSDKDRIAPTTRGFVRVCVRVCVYFLVKLLCFIARISFVPRNLATLRLPGVGQVEEHHARAGVEGA